MMLCAILFAVALFAVPVVIERLRDTMTKAARNDALQLCPKVSRTTHGPAPHAGLLLCASTLMMLSA